MTKYIKQGFARMAAKQYYVPHSPMAVGRGILLLLWDISKGPVSLRLPNGCRWCSHLLNASKVASTTVTSRMMFPISVLHEP